MEDESEREEIIVTMAKAIRRADRSYFNENYMKQARSVIKALNEAGWGVVPLKPDQETVDAGREQIEEGRYKPSDVARAVYTAMVRMARL